MSADAELLIFRHRKVQHASQDMPRGPNLLHKIVVHDPEMICQGPKSGKQELEGFHSLTFT